MTWLALFAMLALALAPTVSRSLAAARGDATGVEICTTSGAAVLAGRSSEPAAPNDSAGLLAHCGYCLQSSDVLGMPPASAAAMPRAPHLTEDPPRFVLAPRTPAAWRLAQPRAPPPLS